MKCAYCDMRIPSMYFYRRHLYWNDCCPEDTLLSEVKDVIKKAELDMYDLRDSLKEAKKNTCEHLDRANKFIDEMENDKKQFKRFYKR